MVIALSVRKYSQTSKNSIAFTDESTKIRKSVGIRLMRLIPRKTRKHKTLVLSNYYHYMGSLTTPPCCENVSWFVLKHRVPITDYQVFIKLFEEVQNLLEKA